MRRSPENEERTRVGLNALLSATDVDTFLREYWERKPLLNKGADEAAFRALLSMQDFDAVLNSSGSYSPALRLVRNGSNVDFKDAEGQPNVGRLFQEYRRGATVIYAGIHDVWHPVEELCRALSLDVSAGISANAYLTPLGGRGFRTHVDTHDVFVLQVSGHKAWTIFDPIKALPRLSDRAEAGTDYGEPMRDIVLEPGDVLYLPRGYPHHAVPTGIAASLHVTVGIHPVTWADVVISAVQAEVDANPELRRSLPVSFAVDDSVRESCSQRLRELLIELTNQTDLSAAIADAHSAILLRRRPSLLGHLVDLEALDELTEQTPIQLRPGCPYHLSTDNESVYLTFNGTTVRMPRSAEQTLHRIIHARFFTSANLGGSLEDSGRLALVSRLLEEGFLTFAPRMGEG